MFNLGRPVLRTSQYLCSQRPVHLKHRATRRAQFLGSHGAWILSSPFSSQESDSPDSGFSEANQPEGTNTMGFDDGLENSYLQYQRTQRFERPRTRTVGGRSAVVPLSFNENSIEVENSIDKPVEQFNAGVGAESVNPDDLIVDQGHKSINSPTKLVRTDSFGLPPEREEVKAGIRSDSDQFQLMSTFPSVSNLQISQESRETPQQEDERVTSFRVFRAMAPYIAVHRGSVVVIHVPGEVLLSHMADSVMHDIILLKTLGVKPVLVAGCRPQIRKRLADFGVKSFFVHGSRVCDYETLQHCQSVAGHVRVEIESLLGRGVVNSPTDMGNVAVASGNFVRAIPFGVRHGIDFKYTGTVQKVHARNIMSLLDQGYVVLLGHLGYSPSGEIFHCRAEEVAVAAAAQLRASKLILLHNGECLIDHTRKMEPVVHNLSVPVAKRFVERLKSELGEEGNRIKHSDADPMQQWELQFLDYMQCAISATEQGVQRAHLVSRRLEGSIVSELCTRDGMGIMISRDIYEGVRPASLKDVPSILNNIRPLEERGILVTRPPEQIESEIGRFVVYERDGEVLACCQMKAYEDERYGKGAVEMSCVAVSPKLRNEGIGNALLSYCSRNCVLQGFHHLFVLTTRSQHWFLDRGFELVPPQSLPPSKYAVYDQNRKPKVYFKKITSERMVDAEDLHWNSKMGVEEEPVPKKAERKAKNTIELTTN